MPQPSSPKLLDQVRSAIWVKHYSYRTEETYVNWIKRFILFHHKRHPQEMNSLEIEQFLTYLAVERNVAARLSFLQTLPRPVERHHPPPSPR